MGRAWLSGWAMWRLGGWAADGRSACVRAGSVYCRDGGSACGCGSALDKVCVRMNVWTYLWYLCTCCARFVRGTSLLVTNDACLGACWT